MSNTRKPKNKPKAIDFDKIRPKRDTLVGDLPPIKIGGTEFTLPQQIPLAVTEYFAGDLEVREDNLIVRVADMQHLLRDIFGDDQWAEITRRIGIMDVPALFSTVFDTYRESVGESTPSGQS